MSDTDQAHIAEVLSAFGAACPWPTAADIASWVEQYPDLADKIRDHAEASLQMAQTEDPSVAPSEAQIQRSRAVTARLLDEALGPKRTRPASKVDRPPPSFER